MIGLIAVVAVLLVAGAIASTGTAAAAAVGTSATAATTKSTTRILREHPTTETRRQTRLNSHNRQPTPPQTQSQLPKKTRDDYLVRGLVEVEPAFADFAGTMYAGLIPTITTPFEEAIDQDETKHQSSSLMFWLFVPDDRPDPNDDTLVVWLNGGPGCSSLGGALFEHGPVTIPLTRAGSMGFADDQKNSTTTDRLGSNPYAWTHATAMLYVEQPVGTGFATDNTINEQNQQSTGVHNETDVGRDFYGFLQNFYDIFDRPEEGSPASETKPAPANTTAWRDKPLYLFGESYAGMYVPSIAHYVYHENKKHNDDKQQQQKPEQQEPSRPPIDVSNPPRSRSMKSRTIPLAGIALGNGWMNALVQGPAVIDYAWWHGMIDTATVHALHQEWDNCQYNFKQEQKQEHHHHHRDDNSNDPSSMRQRERGEPRPFHRFTVPDECGILEAVLAAAGAGAVSWGAPNAYDVTTWDPYLMLDSPFGAIHQFFNNPAVQTALNLPIVPVDWEECLPGAGRRRRMLSKKPLLPGQVLLAHDRPISVVPYVAELLDKANIRVLVYSGDRDMTTNAQGSELLLNSMEWSGAEGWATAYERGLWFPKHNDPHRRTFGGYIKSYANLEFLIVYNSGHLVPFNRDEIALDLVTRFLGRRPFLDKSLPKFHVESLNHKSPSRHDTLRESSDNAALPVVPTAKPSLNRHVWTFLLGLVSFLLGIFVSQFLSLQRRGDYQTIPNHEK